ncbi:MAG TPA: N-acetylmuramoyl-L-alanine amidase [Gemmatimonadales bacterium]
MTPFKKLTCAVVLLTSVTGSACAQQSDSLPPVPPVHGALRVVVAYPQPNTALDVGDSIFLFGTSGNGDATVTVAGQPAHVAPNGAWLAWVAIPADSAFTLRITARAGHDSATSSLRLLRAGWVREVGAWVDPHSLSPTGDIAMPPDEPLPLTVRAAPGAEVRLRTSTGTVIRFASDSIADPVREGVRAFDHDDRNFVRPVHDDRYVATVRGSLNPARNGELAPGAHVATTGQPPELEIILAGDTTRLRWPISVTRTSTGPLAVLLSNDTSAERITIGRAYPGGTYTWFFPSGTRTRLDMWTGDQARLRLSRQSVAWVPLSEVHLARAVDDARSAIVGSPILATTAYGATLRIPLTRAVPSQVEETDRGIVIHLFDAVSNTNWIRYGAHQRFVSLVTPRQESADRVALEISFDRPLWGWRSRIDGTDLIYDFRAPPPIDSLHPLAGRRIVIDPGHPPNGACGPTGLCEPEANLSVALVVRDELAAAGADVRLTRIDNRPVSLGARVAFADSIDADLLVSIHQNALPDGLNPFTNNGTSTYFNHPQSLALARDVQQRLVTHLALPDLAVTRGDLALVRPTWYPAILTEGLFLMFPDQENALRTAQGRRAYAAGIVEGITDYLQEMARRPEKVQER